MNRHLAASLGALYLSGFAVAEPAPLTPDQIKAATLTDEFSVPTPGEFMAALNKTGKMDWASKARPPIPTNFSSRAQQALNLGTLIADGYIAVESEDKQAVKNVGRDIVDLAKPLGVKEEIVNRGKSLTEFADDAQWDVLREELEATQNEVKVKFSENDDKDLITLVTVGGWARGTEVVAALIAQNYTPEGAKLIRQPGIIDFLSARLDELPPKLRDDPAVKRARVKLIELKATVSFPRETTPDADAVKKVATLAGELVKDLARKDLK
ncbi:MAG: hypothetical protein ABMA13_07135 [Chthoniobacteraceae bacterium]